MEDNIRILLPEQEVNERIAELGRQISEDYAGKSVHLICILKGSVFLRVSWRNALPFRCRWILCL